MAGEPRQLERAEDMADVLALAFVSWVYEQFDRPPCSRVAWNDASGSERVAAIKAAAIDLGYET